MFTDGDSLGCDTGVAVEGEAVVVEEDSMMHGRRPKHGVGNVGPVAGMCSMMVRAKAKVF